MLPKSIFKLSLGQSWTATLNHRDRSLLKILLKFKNNFHEYTMGPPGLLKVLEKGRESIGS